MAKKLSRYKLFDKSPEEYDYSIDVQKFNGNAFREHCMGSRKRLIVFDRMVGTQAIDNNITLGNLSKPRFVAFLGRFNKQLYKRFRTIPELYSVEIKHKCLSKGKNAELWESMAAGRYFYNLDIKKAYWQMGYRLNYIDHSFYQQYIDNDEFKQAMRLCFSFLARKNHMNYYDKHGRKTTIECDTSVLKKAFSNVREKLYVEIDELKAGLNVIEYNIDGFSVLAGELDEARKRFAEKGILFKVVECRKIDDYTYSYGNDKVKNFKLQKKVA